MQLSIRTRLLQLADQTQNISAINQSLSPAAGDTSFQSINGSAASAFRRPFNPATAHIDSSMVLTILILLTALVFFCFFSVYVRCSAAPPASRKGGLDPSAVGSLPLVAYVRAAAMTDECPICLTEFEERERVKLIPRCGHVFHGGCIDAWLSSHVTCPLCRCAQLFQRGDEGEEGFVRV